MFPLSEDEIVELIRPLIDAELLAVYLFGSAAEGTLRADSDVDLAVLANRPLDRMQRFEAEQDLATALHRDVDLIDLRRAPAFLRGRIVGTGRCLFRGNEEQVGLFEVYALSSYARFQEETRELVEMFDQRYRD